MDPEDLLTLVRMRMPFGKYQGWLLADLPGPYLAWFAREGFPTATWAACSHSCTKSTTTAWAGCSSRYVAPDL